MLGDAIARQTVPDTVTSMTPHTLGPAGLTYQDLLVAILKGPEDERPLLLIAATTLARAWELLDPATRIADGCAHIAASTFNNLAVPARVVPLPEAIVESLAGREGTVFDVLGENPSRRGQLFELAQIALTELDLPSQPNFEDLLLIHLAALIEEAATPEQAASAARTAGLLPPNGQPDQPVTSTMLPGGYQSAEATTRHLSLARLSFAT